MTQIKGWHVFAAFAAAFSVIIAVNLTLAYQAVATFPGLEVRNSYVASQSFDADRKAQLDLNWQVSAVLHNHELRLVILENNRPIAPDIISATFGRATNVAFDETPDFTFDGTALVAPVTAGDGNWNLRLKARSAAGVLFQQRIVVRGAS